MDNVFMVTSFTNPTPIKLKNLSPEKYGKAAYDENRTYTPSKLAENVLYRQVTTLRKVQEGNGKVRQFEAYNSLLRERVAQAQQQKQGIQRTLNEQIIMYKKMLKQKQEKNQIRLREIQLKFRQQIKQLIEQKQQEVKYFQSQKQILENRIEQLENYINELNQRLTNEGGAYNQLRNQKEKKQIELKNLNDRYQKMDTEKSLQISKVQQSLMKLNDEFKEARNEWKVEYQKAMTKKQTQKNIMQRTLEGEIQKVQNLRITQNQLHQQQIKNLELTISDLKHLMQKQSFSSRNLLDQQQRKYIEMLKIKQDVIQGLHREIESIKNSTSKMISQLQRENVKLESMLNQMNAQNESMGLQINQMNQIFTQQRFNLMQHIQTLKEQIKFNQINYVREKDKNQAVFSQNIKLLQGTKQSEILLRQVSDLRELLLESSKEIQICREKFVIYERENKKLRYELDRVIAENDSLLRLRRQLEQQAVKWRQNYLRLAH